MYLFNTLQIIGLIISLLVAYANRKVSSFGSISTGEKIHNVARFIYYPIFGFIFSLIAWIAIVLIGSLDIEGDYTDQVTHELIAFNEADSTSNFGVGSDVIEDRLVYTYYRYSDDEDGSIVKRYISADLTKVYEHDTIKTPRVVIDIVPGHRDHNWLPIIGKNDGYQKYTLYLPKGTLKNNQ